MKQSAFYLIDCLVALAIVLFGATACLILAKQSTQFLFLDQERSRAWEILDHSRSLPAELLEQVEERRYDVHGMPCDAGGKYLLHLTVQPGYGMVTYWCEVTYRDGLGQDRRLSAKRHEWRPL